MAELTEEERAIMTVWLCLEDLGQNPDGETVWKVIGAFSRDEDAERQCLNEYFAIGPVVLNEVPTGTTSWEGLRYPRRGVVTPGIRS